MLLLLYLKAKSSLATENSSQYPLEGYTEDTEENKIKSVDAKFAKRKIKDAKK